MLKGQKLVDSLDSRLVYSKPLCFLDDALDFDDYNPDTYDDVISKEIRTYLVSHKDSPLVLKFADLKYAPDEEVLRSANLIRVEAEVLKKANGQYGLPKLFAEYSNREESTIGVAKDFVQGIILENIDFSNFSKYQCEKMKSNIYKQQDFLAENGIFGLDINPTNIICSPGYNSASLFDFDKCVINTQSVSDANDHYQEDREGIDSMFDPEFHASYS